MRGGLFAGNSGNDLVVRMVAGTFRGGTRTDRVVTYLGGVCYSVLGCRR